MWDSRRGKRFLVFCKAAEITLWVAAAVCVVATRGDDLCIALMLVATAFGLVRALADKRTPYT